MVLKTDQEPASVESQDPAKREQAKQLGEIATNIASVRGVRGEVEVIQEHSLVGGSQSKGAIENCIKQVQGEVRAL